MKELFLLLALTFNPSAQNYSDAAYRDLWAKVDAAIEQGKPQTAANLLGELEQLTINKKDTLEQYRVMKKRYECLSKYNWKEANKYYPSYNELSRQITNNLEYYIEKYVNHPRVDALVYEKVLKMKREVDMSSRNLRGNKYREVRKACVKAAEVFPKSEYTKEFLGLVEQMDSKSVGIGCEKAFIYPGETLEFELSGRNLDQSEFVVYRLGDRYEVMGGESLKNISGHGRLVSKQKMSSYKNEYNVDEVIKTEFCFGDPGIYFVANSASGLSNHVLIYVSRVALATRDVDGHNEVYVADPKTGKPYDNATIYAYSGEWTDDKGEKAFAVPQLVSQKAYSLKGFTPLSQQLFAKKFSSAQLVAEATGDRWAPMVHISEPSEVITKTRNNDVLHYIYTDRKLYRAGDTVQFKLIALSTNWEQGKVLSGKKITVSLYAPTSDKAAATLNLTTNAMGSVAGAFVIPAGSKMGSWRVASDRNSTWIQVEAYKDPKYKIEFEKIEDVYTFGEPIVQTGRLLGYTGEGVANARVEYTVESYAGYYGRRTQVAEGSARTDENGYFEVPFTATAPDDKYITTVGHNITVRTVAPGGETCESGKVVTVSRKALNFTPKFDNEYRMDTLLLVNKDRASKLTITATNADGVEQKAEGWYRLTSAGRTRREGKFTFGTPIDFEAKSLPSGEYTLEYGAQAIAGGQQEATTLAFLSPDDRTCPVKRDMFFYPVVEKDAIDFVVGTADDLYLEVEVFDNGKCVYRRPLHLKGSAEHIKLDYKSSYSDQVTVSVYGFKNFEEVSNRYNFGREVPSNNFDVKITSLRDKTTPNTTETFTVEAPASEMMISIYDVTCDRYGKNSFYFDPIHPHYSRAPFIWSNIGGVRPLYRTGNVRMLAKAAGSPMAESMVMNDAMAVEESAMDFGAAKEDGPLPSPDQIDVREDFSQTLAFIPQLQIPASGKSNVSFTTRDGLSTFRIALLAHTKDLKSGTAESQIVVDKAVKIESTAPLFATEGDILKIKAIVTNTGIEPVKGRATLSLTDEDDLPLDIDTDPVEVDIAPGKSTVVSWEVKIPKNVTKMGVTTAFASKKATDAEKHQVEIVPASRYITEAESFIVGGSRNKQSCIRDLKARFPYPDAQIR